MAAVLAGLAWAGPSRAGDAEAVSLQIGMVQGIFRDVQPGMVRALARPLQDMIQKQTGFNGGVEIAADPFILADRLDSKRYQFGVFHGFEFAWVKQKHPDFVPLAVTVPPGRKLQACVVVHVDSKMTCLADLKDECVVLPRGTKAHCYAYLDRERAGLPAGTAKPRAKPPANAEEALDAVVAGDAPAAVVDAAALAGYQSLQPGAFKQLRVLSKSESFPPTVVAYKKGAVDDETVEKVRQLLTTAHQTPTGKPLMMLWNLKGFEDVPADYDVQLEKIGKAYPSPAPVAVTAPTEK
ncbi:hypothetical protein FRUB_04014 [Fimbriiglobus ruber]|uniref:Phosphate/phosphite/phosphonate ABC transporter substrate-binding protein n=1 Tax=Fimbriiglobus ruber TaxID=1908690 RepID=A0A225DWB6_9BACT|nr:hypothetical protein FRUB_04014 [Fimbriiglobus ruber]